MQGYLESFIINDLKEKTVLLTGRRQSRKTTLSKQLGLQTLIRKLFDICKIEILFCIAMILPQGDPVLLKMAKNF